MKPLTFPSHHFFLFVFLSLLVCLGSCKKDDIPTNTGKLFTLTVDADYSMDDARQYVVLSDKNGTVIDLAEYTPGKKFEFPQSSTFTDEELMVTFLQDFSDQTYLIESYLNVKKGTTWTLKKYTYVEPAKAGEITLDLSNLQSKVNEVEVASRDNSSYLAIAKLSSTDWTPFTYPLSKSKENLWIRASDAQTSRYFLLEQAEAGSTYILDFSKFVSGNVHTIAINKPDFTLNSLLLLGYQDNVPFRVFSNWNQHPPTQSVSVSYPKTSFEKFSLDLSIQKPLSDGELYEEERYGYHIERPTLPNTLPELNADLALQNVSVDNYQMTTQGNYDYFSVWYRSIQGDSDRFIDWYVRGKPQNNVAFKLPNIPKALTNNLALTVKWRATTLHEYPLLQSYDELLNGMTTIYPNIPGDYFTRMKKVKSNTR